jgi:isoleucyl-tRNA synthetase
MTDESPKGPDYSASLYLPKTDFPMRAGLPQKEPRILERWSDTDLYGKLRAAAKGRPKFVLHDGPPYANGAIHIGHALNKILKDVVTRSQQMLGKDSNYVPGWDCHGLPIEWKIEEDNYRSKGKKKPELSDPAAMIAFRRECRAYAADWLNKQREEFKRLGVVGDWAHPYATMDFPAEAQIARELMKFAMNGLLYRGSKPVMWSPVERTALADAEVEYHDHVSPTVWVKFPVSNEAALEGATIVIWTTTPWTIPANRAISFNPKVAYGLYEVVAMAEGLAFEPWAKAGDRLIVADNLAADVASAAKIADWVRLRAVDPTGLIARHPLAAMDPGYGFDVPLLAGDHVTEDAGTGFVHTAPGHGQDDYQVWLDSGRSRDSIPDTVDADGAYYPDVPLFGGLKVLETEGKKSGKFGPANGAVMDKLIEAGNLLALQGPGDLPQHPAVVRPRGG